MPLRSNRLVMSSRNLPLLLAVLLGTAAWVCGAEPVTDAAPGTDWRQFRGTGASGVGRGYPLPVAWNVETGDEVAWRTPIPGLGHSGVIVTGDRVVMDFSPSPQGRAGPSVLEISRYSELEGGDDKLTCAGTIDAFVRGAIGELATSK